MVVSDVNDVFVPLQDGFLVDLEESRYVLWIKAGERVEGVEDIVHLWRCTFMLVRQNAWFDPGLPSFDLHDFVDLIFSNRFQMI